MVSAFSRRRPRAPRCRSWRCRPVRSGRISRAAGAAGLRLHARRPARGHGVGRCRRRRGAEVRHRPRYSRRMVEGVSFQGARRFDRRSIASQSEPSGGAGGAVAGQGKSLRSGRPADADRSTPMRRRRASNSRRQNSAASARRYIFNLFQATVNVSYTPDVFGGQRRLIEARRRWPTISASSSRRPI